MSFIRTTALHSTFLAFFFTPQFLQPTIVLAESSNMVRVDGSSTVYPITEAVAEEFAQTNKDIKVTVGISGTGGGFKKFCAGEIDISDASRPIKTSEIELCQKNSITYIELPIAYDALSVVINPKNSWVTSLTVNELKKIWEPGAQEKITTWKQIRADFPDRPLRLFGAGVDSGTYDYFTEAIVGTEHSSRGDFTSSEDDNVLVQGVANDVGALGFFGMSYYEENKSKIRAIGVDDEKADNGSGPQMPTSENVLNGRYQPLSRPLFIYVRKDSLSRPEVKAFVEAYLEFVPVLSGEVGYVPLSSTTYPLVSERYRSATVGSMFAKHGSQPGVSIDQLLRAVP